MGTRKYLIVDENDNILDIGELKKNEEMVIHKVRTPEQKKFLTSKYKLHDFLKNCGEFLFMYVKKNEILFNGLNLQPANISRLIYLATYIQYNNKQENLLIIKDSDNKTKSMTKKEMMKLLNLKQKAFYDFIRDLKQNNLLYEADDKFYLSSDYFSKGKCPFDGKEYVRVFINPVRQLYENCTPRQHKTLSYVFRLLSKMNYETNIICHNPLEQNPKKMSLKDIGEFLGIYNTGNLTTLKNQLFSFYIMENGKKYHIFYHVTVQGEKFKNNYFIINPKLCWGGKSAETAIQLFNKLIMR